jgi:hypothetical protein
MPEKPGHIEMAEALRALANMIEHTPEVADLLSYPIRYMNTPVSSSAPNQAAVLGTFMRAANRHGAVIEKSGDDKWFHVTATWGPVTVHAYADRENVCERVVVGTETVTETVPDPDLLAQVPTIEVTTTREITKWNCVPLLAASETA